jgi:threonine/homoserine/homoserine lactone efflux protein
MLLSVVFAGLYLLWFGVYVLGVDLLGTALRKPKVKAAIERVTGTLLIGFGGMLATASAG